MQLKHLSQSELVKKVGIWVVSILLLFFGFYTNLWHVAEQQWFANHQKDTEAHIMGRMVKSRQDGIFSAGGLNGWGTAKRTDAEWIPSTALGPQYTAYLYKLSFDKFSPYMSQPGGQGMVFSLLDRLIPLSPQVKLWSFYVLTALLSAIALTAIIGWFYEAFGGWVAIFVIGSAVLSQWLTVFGKNLWWSLWAFYLPMIAVMYFLKRYRETLDRQLIRFGIVIFIAVSIKCFINGYEYITTTLLMMMAPFVYYVILDKWNRQQCVKWTLAAGLGSGVAIFFSFIMLCFQIGAAKDGFMDGVEHIIWSFGKRTYGEAEDFPPVYAASLEAGTIGVVITYMNGIFFDLNNYFSQSNLSKLLVFNFLLKVLKVRYYYLIVLFVVMSALLFWRSNKEILAERRPHYIALIWTTWFSMLAPLSWFVIFKAHSYIHTHMSFLLWQMPFTLFGFAVFGSAVIAWTKKTASTQG
ncbi:hypothetical protein C6503_00210 [Candidatus Poribacteria bacterium]|nr:MAG: hypothetical protein C6503_00210 [Candidatus Poribacteria bacterium]